MRRKYQHAMRQWLKDPSLVPRVCMAAHKPLLLRLGELMLFPASRAPYTHVCTHVYTDTYAVKILIHVKTNKFFLKVAVLKILILLIGLEGLYPFPALPRMPYLYPLHEVLEGEGVFVGDELGRGDLAVSDCTVTSIC